MTVACFSFGFYIFLSVRWYVMVHSFVAKLIFVLIEQNHRKMPNEFFVLFLTLTVYQYLKKKLLKL